MSTEMATRRLMESLAGFRDAPGLAFEPPVTALQGLELGVRAAAVQAYLLRRDDIGSAVADIYRKFADLIAAVDQEQRAVARRG